MEIPTAPHLKSGIDAEAAAAIFLQNKGLKLLTKNYKTAFGEIDLIMQDRQTLVFVEVRLRKNERFGGASMSITPAKQQKLQRTAAHYLQINGEQACRFDAVLMQSAREDAIEWLQNII